MQKQRALVENEQLRMELEATHIRNAEHESLQTTYFEAESKICCSYICSETVFKSKIRLSLCLVCVLERAQASEQRYNMLKEKHTELVGSHAELLRKVHTPDHPEMFASRYLSAPGLKRVKCANRVQTL